MKCRYTGVTDNLIMRPNVLPQVSSPIYVAKDAMHLYKAEVAAFQEHDANCNACKHFDRLKADNEKGSNPASNFVYGNCKNNGQYDKLKSDGYQIMVHVADYMGMPCWESR